MTTREIDLRSDTVTLPSAEMRAAMAAAELGDDVYGEDPSVAALEARAAAMLGKEAALFVPSGTMGNLIAVMVHTRPGDEIICGRYTHTYIAEGAGAARLAGVSVWPVPHERGCLDLDEVEAGFHPDDPHYPRTGLLIVEQPNRGWVMPLDHLATLSGMARRRGVPVHMDGARIFNAAVALRVEASDIAKYADSVMFCVSKGLAAPVGSVLLGSSAFVTEARRARKVLGGGMRQAGVLAAGALYALNYMVSRMAEDHAYARRLADGLRTLGWEVDREDVQTNIVFARPPDHVSADAMLAGLEAAGLRVASPYSDRTIRLVTHYGLDAADIDRALDAFRTVTGTPEATGARERALA